MCECENCGHELSDNYVRVCLPANTEAVEMCPNCPQGDKQTTTGSWRNSLNEPVKTGE